MPPRQSSVVASEFLSVIVYAERHCRSILPGSAPRCGSSLSWRRGGQCPKEFQARTRRSKFSPILAARRTNPRCLLHAMGLQSAATQQLGAFAAADRRPLALQQATTPWRGARCMNQSANRMRRVFAIATMCAALQIVPAVVWAQATITGTVKDTSGAVLPGVTVEASSPALIERVRSVVSDATGQYRIVDLRPGTYSVTFSLTGFSTVKREGIELTGNFVATVNADLKVGALEETITVTGETPVVDVQSVKVQQTVSKE